MAKYEAGTESSGPWEYRRNKGKGPHAYWLAGGRRALADGEQALHVVSEDIDGEAGRLAAAAVNALPALCDRVEEAEETSIQEQGNAALEKELRQAAEADLAAARAEVERLRAEVELV